MMVDLITYTDDIDGMVQYARSITDDWEYIIIDEDDNLKLIMDKTNTFYNDNYSISLIKLPVRDVYGESGNKAGFMLALDGYLEVLAVGINRGDDNDPFYKCWGNAEETAKYDLAFPRTYYDDGSNALMPRMKFCEFDS